MFFFDLLVGVYANWIALALGVVLFFVLGFSRASYEQAIAYTCFFICGAVVGKWQWWVLVVRDTETLWYLTTGTIILVGLFGYIGILASIRSMKFDRRLLTLVVATVILTVVYFSGLPDRIVSVFACAYAVLSVAAPILQLLHPLTSRDEVV